MNLDSELVDLIIQRSNGGLSAAEQRHLDRLIQSSPRPDQMLAEIQRLELSIAAVELSYLAGQTDHPDHLDRSTIGPQLQTLIKSQSIEAVERNKPEQPKNDVSLAKNRDLHLAPPIKRSAKREIFTWVTAAASLLALAFFIRQAPYLNQPSTSSLVTNPIIHPVRPGLVPELVDNMMPHDELMQKFLASTPEDLLTLSWSPVDSKNVTGNVFWSDRQQTGFMTFSGLEINDPLRRQYQVWIYDTDTQQSQPVNGGVFDVSKSGRYVVPIAPKSPVKKAVQFAITTEQPGGVDVSQRQHVPTVASPSF